jgi:hypothetical protein
MIARAAMIAGDLLQTNQIGVLFFDDLDDPLQTVEPITAADAFVDVVTQKSHRSSFRRASD